MTLGEKILQVRKDNGWSQAKLAELVDVKQQAVCQWELGSTKPALKTLRRIAHVADVPLEELTSYALLSDLKTESKPETGCKSAAGQESAAENFNEYLRQHIIGCVEGLDDRIALLDITSKVEQVLRDLAEEEMEKELYHED